MQFYKRAFAVKTPALYEVISVRYGWVGVNVGGEMCVERVCRTVVVRYVC